MTRFKRFREMEVKTSRKGAAALVVAGMCRNGGSRNCGDAAGR